MATPASVRNALAVAAVVLGAECAPRHRREVAAEVVVAEAVVTDQEL